MFTGIVEAVGKIRSVTPQGQDKNAGVRLEIDAGDLPMEKIRVGDSVAINGACMTVVERTDNRFKVDVSRESLDRTTGLDKVHEVNLEKALALGDMLGGILFPVMWMVSVPYAGSLLLPNRGSWSWKLLPFSGNFWLIKAPSRLMVYR